MTDNQMIEALGKLEAATKTLLDLKAYIDNHNLDHCSHPYLVEIIEKIKNSDLLYTNTQIEQLIKEGLKVHQDTDFDKAHPGWERWVKSNEDVLASLAGRIQDLETWRDTGVDTSSRTSLQRKLSDIENKYLIILSSLQTALIEADNTGNTVVAEEIKTNIQTTLNTKNQEIMDAITAWQEEQRQPTA